MATRYCSFCGQHELEQRIVAEGPSARICGFCIIEIMQREFGTDPALELDTELRQFLAIEEAK